MVDREFKEMKSSGFCAANEEAPTGTSTSPRANAGFTAKQVEEVLAGSELDQLVAQRVMGWRWRTLKYVGDTQVRPVISRMFLGERDYQAHLRGSWAATDEPFTETVPKEYYGVPRFSTDISAAWEIVERLSRSVSEGYGFRLERGPGVIHDGVTTFHLARFFCATGPLFDVKALAATAPLAICRAALLILV